MTFFDYKQLTSNFDKLLNLQKAVYPDVIEMAQIKQDIDSTLLTVGERGKEPSHLVASKFHFLMRQYRFGLSEGVRYFIELLEVTYLANSSRYYIASFFSGKFRKLQKLRLEQQYLYLLPEIYNQLTRVEFYEKLRVRLIELNGGKQITNVQFQSEQPEYWQWFLANEFAIELAHLTTGYSKGLLKAHENLTKLPVIVSDSIRAMVPIIDIPTMKLNTKLITNLLSGSDERQLDTQYQRMLDTLESFNMSKLPLAFEKMRSRLQDSYNNGKLILPEGANNV